MRSNPRLFTAALALVSICAFVRAQDTAAPPLAPSMLDEFGTPVSELRPIPFADGRALVPMPEPALTLDPDALPIEPLGPPAPARAEPSAASKPQSGQGSSVEVTTFFPPVASVAFAGIAAIPPSAWPAAVETSPGESGATGKTGTGGWIVLGLVAAGLLTSIARYRSRLPKRYPPTRVANLSLDPEPVPVPARLN